MISYNEFLSTHPHYKKAKVEPKSIKCTRQESSMIHSDSALSYNWEGPTTCKNVEWALWINNRKNSKNAT